jgi:hypothetical protein
LSFNVLNLRPVNPVSINQTEESAGRYTNTNNVNFSQNYTICYHLSSYEGFT